MAGIAERHRFAAELLAPEPSDRILEIGCGHGIATGLVCARLVAGRLTAIDRSSKMTAACARRNAGAMAAGRLEVLAGAFEAFGFSDPFDKALAVNVDFPGHQGRAWAGHLAAALRPGGRAVLVLEAPAPATAARFAEAGLSELRRAGFATEVLERPGMVALRAELPPFP